MNTCKLKVMRYGLFVLAVSAAISCKMKNRGNVVKSLAVDVNSTNVAFILGAPSTGARFLPGVKPDVDGYTQLFHSPEMTRFKVISVYDQTYSDVTKKFREAVRAVGQNGTLAIIFSGHGEQDTGKWLIENRWVPFSDFLAAIEEERSSMDPSTGKRVVQALGRLIIVSDSCYSGELVNGQLPVTPLGYQNRPRGDGGDLARDKLPSGFVVFPSASACPNGECQDLAHAQIIGSLGDSRKNSPAPPNREARVARQILVVAAADKSKEAQDRSSYHGGAFSRYLIKSFKDMAKDPSKHTIGDWINDSLSRTNAWYSLTLQRPTFAAYPEALLNDYLFAQGSRYNTSSKEQPPVRSDGSCAGGFGREWEANHGRSDNGSCLDATQYCQCWSGENTGWFGSKSRVCGLFPPGSPDGGKALAYVAPQPGDAGCYQSCEVLVNDNKEIFQRQCNGRAIMLNSNGKLEAWQYKTGS